MNAGAAQAWFIAGAIVAILAGGVHVLYALIDTVRPTYFAPIERSVRSAMEGTSIRLRSIVHGSGARPPMWRVWLGIHIGFGLGLFTFGLLCLLIATYDFNLVQQIDAIRPIAIGFTAAFVVVSLRFFLFDQVIITATATACFIVAAVLSA